MQSLMILGRQPALGLAELESLYGAAAVRPVGSQAAVVDVDPCLLAFDRLGGSVKFCKVLTVLDTTNWGKIEKFLLQAAPEHARTMPAGKMQLGLSLYDLRETPQRIGATGLRLKKAIRNTGRSVRLIPNNDAALNTAQVMHNHLTGANGWELVFVRDGQQTIVAQSVKVQDITSYTRRDRLRPRRDARVGMLPPKLAQIIINLAVGQLPEESRQSVCEFPADFPIPAVHYDGVTILDPFCGTGVILQEAVVMGYDVAGSDIDPRMVEYTKQNLTWLMTKPEGTLTKAAGKVTATDSLALPLVVADATSHKWEPRPSVVASETYLGRPFTTQPTAELLSQTMGECNLIIKKFLRNLHVQLQPGNRLCVAVPAWQYKPRQFRHLPLVDSLGEMGYNRVKFERVSDDQLIYYRDDQIVARELLVLTVK